MGRLRAAIIAGLALLVPAAVGAQPAPRLSPGTGLPGVRSPIPGVVPPTAPATAPPAAPPLAAPGAAPSETVAIADVAILGSTAYPAAAWAPLEGGLVGPAVPVARIEAARVGILNRYRSDGYPYVAVNARIGAGHLRFVVIEGRIVAVKLRGDIGPAGTQVLRFLNHLTTIAPVSQAAIERWLLLANDIPGVSVRGVIDPSATDPGALTLEAEVRRRPFDVLARADNRAFRQTGPEELLTVLQANSFTSLGEQTELSLYHTFNNTETFGQAAETVFLGGSGLRLRLFGGAGESVPSGFLRAIGYDGVTRVFGASLSYPLIRARSRTLTLSLHADGTESDIATGATGRPLRASFDSLRVLRAEANYVQSDLWLPFLGQGLAASNIADVRVSQGLPIFGASRNTDPQLPLLGERVDFTKVDAEIDRTQPLFTPYGGASVSLLAAVAGQFSNNTLPPEEKYYLGGPSASGPYFNPGYYYGQVTGDRALQAKLEPRLDTPLPRWNLPVPLQAQFYGFFDWGETWQVQKLDVAHTLRSIGGGARLHIGDYAELDVEGVSRLTRTLAANTSRLKASAIYWQVLLTY